MNNQQQKHAKLKGSNKLHIDMVEMSGYVSKPKSQASGHHRINPTTLDLNQSTPVQMTVSENTRIIAERKIAPEAVLNDFYEKLFPEKFAEKPPTFWQKFTRKLGAAMRKALRHFN